MSRSVGPRWFGRSPTHSLTIKAGLRAAHLPRNSGGVRWLAWAGRELQLGTVPCRPVPQLSGGVGSRSRSGWNAANSSARLCLRRRDRPSAPLPRRPCGPRGHPDRMTTTSRDQGARATPVQPLATSPRGQARRAAPARRERAPDAAVAPRCEPSARSASSWSSRRRVMARRACSPSAPPTRGRSRG